MPTYITLARFTRQGLEHIKESPTRLEAVKKNFQVKGGSVKAFYLLLGQCDAVVIYEAPNDETVAELMLAIGAAGNVHTETHRAFTEEEYRKVIAAVNLG